MWPLRRVVRLCWWFLTALTLLALPLVCYDFAKRDFSIKYQAWFIGGVFVILSFPISVYEVAMHTEYYTRPRLQRHVIRILWMVPIYAVDAWFALRFRDAREYLDPVRECYEAYVIYNFFAFLMAYLEEELGDVDMYLSRKPPMTHVFPFSLILRPWAPGPDFLLQCKKGVLNYVILRPVCTAIGLITDIFDKYGQGQINFNKSYVYLAFVTNFSQLWALYCLAQFYWMCHKELAPIRPLSKFLCIKAVVFLTFWQGVVIAILVSSGLITDKSWSTYDQLGVAGGIQDFLICIEMFVAALAHAYAFPPKDYMTPNQQSRGFFRNVKHMFDLRDVVEDVGTVVEAHATTATEAVMETTEAVLAVPKVAAKTVAKGFKKAAEQVTHPESLLSFLAHEGTKKPGRRARRPKGGSSSSAVNGDSGSLASDAGSEAGGSEGEEEEEEGQVDEDRAVRTALLAGVQGDRGAQQVRQRYSYPTPVGSAAADGAPRSALQSRGGSTAALRNNGESWHQDIESGFALEPADSGGVAGGGTGISPPPGPVIFPSLLNSVLQAQPQQQQQQGTAARAPPSAGGMRPGGRSTANRKDEHVPLLSSSDGTDGGT